MVEMRFRSYEPDQEYLLPPRLDESLPQNHMVCFVRDVVKELDLGDIYKAYELEEGGRPPYEPRMMVGLIVYGYCVGTVSSRLEKIREAKKTPEAEAERRAENEAEGKSGEGMGENGPESNGGTGKEVKPQSKAQRNFTDPDSRIMLDKSTNSFAQANNCQAAVDETAQVIVAAEATQEANGKRQLWSMVTLIERNTETVLPRKLSADSGYFSTVQVEALSGMTDLYVATGKIKDSEKTEPRGRISKGLTTKDRMKRKLLTKAGAKVYDKRKQIVEPVSGQIKEARGFRRFSFRGIEKVRDEWLVVCMTHNIL